MRNVRRVAITIAAIVAGSYSGAVAYLMTQETRLVFAAGRPLAASRPQQPFEQVPLDRSNTTGRFAWIMPQSADTTSAPWVLFLHGNAATVASRVNIVRYERLRSLGVNVVRSGISRLRRPRR